MIYKYILDFLPFITLLIMMLLPVRKGKITNMASWLSILYVIILIISISVYPNDPSVITDRDRYEDHFYSISSYGLSYEYKDVGWIFLNVICVKLLGDNIYFLWLVVAVIYVLSYYYFAVSYIDKRRIIYYLVMASGLIGFIGYGTNTLRQGVATAFVLYSLNKNTSIRIKILLLIVALTFHKSIVLIIASFVFAKYIRSFRFFEYFWIICLFLSIINVNVSDILESFAFLDKRVTGYGDELGEEHAAYRVGFRWDFLLYSIIPLVITYIYIFKKKTDNNFYRFIVRSYLFVNAIWLLVIRIPFSDRVAYLSWYLIPFITLYPLLSYSVKYDNPQRMVLLTMFVFMGVNMMLLLRSYLT